MGVKGSQGEQSGDRADVEAVVGMSGLVLPHRDAVSRKKKQYVNLCIAQEAEVKNSLRLLWAEHGPEGIAAAPAKWNLNYILLFHYCVVLPTLFYVILNNYTKWVSQQAGPWTKRFH